MRRALLQKFAVVYLLPGLWIAGCFLNPQPEPPGENATPPNTTTTTGGGTGTGGSGGSGNGGAGGTGIISQDASGPHPGFDASTDGAGVVRDAASGDGSPADPADGAIDGDAPTEGSDGAIESGTEAGATDAGDAGAAPAEGGAADNG